MLRNFINSILIIIFCYLLLKLIKYGLRKIFDITKFDVRYENTLFSVISSISYYIVAIFCIILVLREFNIIDVSKFSTLITGAGIIGLIAGVASQSILKDIFNGFFILFEKQIHVGDFVVLNEQFTGTVEEIGLRSTSIRDWDLRRITISNGNITSVKNYSKNKMRVVAHVRVSYEEDPIKIINCLQEVCDAMNIKYKDYLYKELSKSSLGFKVYGVTDIDKNPIGAQYTITGVVESYKYFQALREARLEILMNFRKNNIHIAYPTQINILQCESEKHIEE